MSASFSSLHALYITQLSGVSNDNASNPFFQAKAQALLEAAFPLLRFDGADARLIQRRRCIACTKVSLHARQLTVLCLAAGLAQVPSPTGVA